MLKLLTLALLVACSLQSPQYDFYKFAKEWSGTTCYNGCDYDSLGMNQWNQHGLWPNKWETFNIPGCFSEQFDIKKFSPSQLQEVQSFWDGMFSRNEWFWKHEFNTHGRCWDPSMGDLSKMDKEIATFVQKSRQDQNREASLMTDYFHTVFLTQNRPELDIYKVLSASGITPSATQSYRISDVKAALSKSFGPNFDLLCARKDGKSMLNEIRICLDLNYNVMKCPQAQFRCKKRVWYPPHHAKNNDETYYKGYVKSVDY